VKIAIVGAGAIGAFLGAKLALSGENVYLIARGPHLRAMQANGVRVRRETLKPTRPPPTTMRPSARSILCSLR